MLVYHPRSSVVYSVGSMRIALCVCVFVTACSESTTVGIGLGVSIQLSVPVVVLFKNRATDKNSEIAAENM